MNGSGRMRKSIFCMIGLEIMEKMLFWFTDGSLVRGHASAHVEMRFHEIYR